MPFANIKVPADTLTPESKKKLQDAVTRRHRRRVRRTSPPHDARHPRRGRRRRLDARRHHPQRGAARPRLIARPWWGPQDRPPPHSADRRCRVPSTRTPHLGLRLRPPQTPFSETRHSRASAISVCRRHPRKTMQLTQRARRTIAPRRRPDCGPGVRPHHRAGPTPPSPPHEQRPEQLVRRVGRAQRRRLRHRALHGHRLKPGDSQTSCIVVTSTGSLPSTVQAVRHEPRDHQRAVELAERLHHAGHRWHLRQLQRIHPAAVRRHGLVRHPRRLRDDRHEGLERRRHLAHRRRLTRSRTYQMTVALDPATPNSAQNGTARIGFTWEAQSS